MNIAEGCIMNFERDGGMELTERCIMNIAAKVLQFCWLFCIVLLVSRDVVIKPASSRLGGLRGRLRLVIRLVVGEKKNYDYSYWH